MYVAWRPGRDSLRRGRRQEETLGGRPELASGPKLTNSDGGPTHSSQASHSFAASQKNIRLNIEQPVTKCSVAADREQRSLDVCPPPVSSPFYLRFGLRQLSGETSGSSAAGRRALNPGRPPPRCNLKGG